MMLAAPTEYLSLIEAARWSGIPVAELSHDQQRGKLRAVTIEDAPHICPIALDEYMALRGHPKKATRTVAAAPALPGLCTLLEALQGG